jgi:nucleoside-diphosphate-sugar epimerase
MRNAIIEEDVDAVEGALRPISKVLEGRHIFLTGGTGFFGKWLLNSFLGLRDAVSLDTTLTVLSRDPKGFLDACPEFAEQAGLDFITGDVRSFTPPSGRTFDFVIHGATAASAKLEQEDPDEMYSVITDGTRHVLDFMRPCSAKRLMFISSGAVYGVQPTSMNSVPETYAGDPVTAYGKGKKLSEQLCLDASSVGRFECVIARPFAFVGPHLPLDTHFAIGNFINDCLEDRPIIINGDGTPLRSYLYAADLAEWLWTILLRGEPLQSYNVGSGEAVSIGDLARLVRECAGTQNEIIVRGTKTDGALPARYVPSVVRAEKELALRQRHSLSDAVRRTIAWHRNPQSEGSCR